jgi:hypothetical protein
VLVVLIDDTGFGASSAFGGETNQYAPAIYRDTVPVEPDRTRSAVPFARQQPS